VITVIRALTINRLPKKTFLALWGITLVRLLIPFSFGITYQEVRTDDTVKRHLYYKGQPVQKFWDVNDERAFSFSDDIDGIYVQVVRDENGQIVDVEEVTEPMSWANEAE
jgi:hypothetical protein